MLAISALVPASAGDRPATGTDQLSKILTDPEKLEELKKEKLRPPIEFFRSQILPNDILPYLKANHWSMVGLEMRANHDDYEGTAPVPAGDAGRPAPRDDLSADARLRQRAAGPAHLADPPADDPQGTGPPADPPRGDPPGRGMAGLAPGRSSPISR